MDTRARSEQEKRTSSKKLPKNIQTVYAREGYRGTPTGEARPCRRGECDGTRIAVRWPARNVTWPCTRDMDEIEPGTWQIIEGRP